MAIDSLKLSYDDIVNGINVAPPKWADKCYQEGWQPTNAMDFYEDIFGDDLAPHRERDEYSSKEDGKPREYLTTYEYSGIAIERLKSRDMDLNGRLCNKIIFTRGNQELYDLIRDSRNTIFLSPASYCGKNRTTKNARFLYALCVEIDGLKGEKKYSPNKTTGFDEMVYCWTRTVRTMPMPTYVVCSGRGVHLYWVFEHPVPLFRNIHKQLSKMRKELIRNFWTKAITYEYNSIQYEHLLQGFRAVGSVTKNKKSYAMAFKVGNKVSLEYMNEHVSKANHVTEVYKTDLPLARAKELYPEWYERRIVRKEEKGHYTRHRGIYDNWIDKMYAAASVGHRYHCLLNLVALATQCDIPFEEVKEDCYKLRDYLDELTIDAKENPFTDYDVECALTLYGSPEAFNRNIDYVSEQTAIPIKRNERRRGLPQSRHMQRMQEDRDYMYPNGEWRDNGGAKPKWDIVQDWKQSHPSGTKAACARDTGLSKPTVIKWWDVEEDPDSIAKEAAEQIARWRFNTPLGSKEQCHNELHYSMYYVRKYWQQTKPQ